MTTKYLLDANVFIEPSKKYYAMDLVPKYWDCLKTCAQDGILSSIDRVRDEVSNNEHLKEWVRNEFPHWESTKSTEVVSEFRQIIELFKRSQHYNKHAKDMFADESKADAWVIAYAKVHNCIVVTDEHWNPERKKKIPIPNACHLLQVEWTGITDMLRKLGIQLSN